MDSGGEWVADTQEILDEIAMLDEEILLADGFNDALVGVVDINHVPVALYDRDRCLDVLVKRDAMTHEEAEEYFDFNVAGAYVGARTPLFATIMRGARWDDD
jgi:hypothetical protein